MNCEITRRDFLGASAGAVSLFGFSLVRLPGSNGGARAAELQKIAEIPVVWMATGACTGCSVALLNSASPTIQELLLEEVLPGKHLSLGFHATVMAASGEPALKALQQTVETNKKAYVLVVDGVTATKEGGLYCAIGEKNGRAITGYDSVRDLGRDALAVLAVGSCSAFGGIPAAGPNPTGGVSVPELFKREGITTPVVRIPGCPPHPDWIVGTVATVLLGGAEALQLDDFGRPAPFFRECIHDNCQFRGHFECGNFAERFGEHGCLLKLGCKGPITFADCSIRKFNGGTSWCCEAGHPCIGCCHEDFPFEQSLFAPVEPAGLSYPEVFPSVEEDLEGRKKATRDTYVAVGLMGFGGFLAGVGVTAAGRKLNAGHRKRQSAASPATEAGKEADHDNT